MEDVERDTMRIVRRRVFYCLFVMFLLNQMDRTNVGFAALQMNVQLGFNAEVYGFGTGLFFFSYLLAEMPSNLMLERFGPRIWLSRITISWGVIAMLMAFVYDAPSFYILRFLLGLAEAGFAPGSIYYINLWAPKRYRAKSVVVSALAIPLSVIIGGPIAGLFLSMDKVAGLAGWQWLFLAEGIPSVLFGLFTLRFLTDRPKDAHWLSPAQKSWLMGELARDASEASRHGISTLGNALRSWRVWRTGIAFFCVTLTTWGLGFWLPQIVKQLSGLTNAQVSLLTTLPFVGLAIGFLLNSWHSDKVQERQWHFVGGALIGAAGLLISATVPSPGGFLRAGCDRLWARLCARRVLSHSDGLSQWHGRGRRPCSHQHDRQQRRLLRLLHHRMAAADDRVVQLRTDVPLYRDGIGRAVAGSVQVWRRRQTQSLTYSRGTRSTP